MSSLFDFESSPDAYAVMGNPIAHSKSPQIHQAFAQQTGQRITYEAILVDVGGLAQAVGNFVANGGKGLNITVPFKRDAWKLVNDRSEKAEQAGAVNTIIVRNDQSLLGDNTDGIGIVRDLTQNHHVTLTAQTILLIGAGGAARGVLGPLLEQKPKSVFIANRTPDRAQELAALFSTAKRPVTDSDIRGGGFNAVPETGFDIVINASAASLQGELPPLPDCVVTAASVCYDMMYGATVTPFMHWGENLGAGLCCDGLGMLVEQAAESFYLWRNVRPQTQDVIRLIRQSLR
jgi:shikimate dehydrogenase